MRILCLHGMGCNAEIFEAQTGQIIWALKQYGHEFVYVDAITPCDAPDERFKSIYPPPYLAWWTKVFSEDINEAVEYIEEVISEDGPFDGVLAFSQGCAASAALMQRHAGNGKDPPFRFAIFMGAPLPHHIDEKGETRQGGDAKLTIPILHVIGRDDPFVQQSRKLAAMHVNPSDSTVLEHSTGHETPRDPLVIAAIVRWSVSQDTHAFCC